MKFRILKNFLIILQSFSLLFQNVRANSQEKVNGWLGGKSKKGGMKFQQHNSSSKNGEEMRRVGVSFIPKEAK
jgi:hypothetical protein